MTSHDQMMLRRMTDIAQSLGHLAKIAATMNENFVKYDKMIREDIMEHKFKPLDPKSLSPRFDLGTLVVVYSETHIRDGWRGKITHLGDMSARVQLEDGTEVFLAGSEMIPLDEKPADTVQDANDVEIPAIVEVSAEEHNARVWASYSRDEPTEEKFRPDGRGWLYPAEWRVNLGVDNITVTNPEDPQLMSHENRRMPEQEFKRYNAGLYAKGTITNLED